MIPWVEKYRPKDFEEVVGLDDRIKKIVEQETNSIPNILLYGPPGTGKTTIARIIVKKVGGECLELNSSDERGIDVIREKVKAFAYTDSLVGKLKFVFLDEADGLTLDSQQSLRVIMERYSKCRFILTCNFLGKIIDPIQSRCSVFQMKELPHKQILERLKYICEKENVEIDEEKLKQIIIYHYPDMRKIINTLQVSVKDGKIGDIKFVENEAKEIYSLIKEFKFLAIRRKIAEGIELKSLIQELEKLIIFDKTLSKRARTDMLIALSDCNRSIGYVAVPRLEFERFCLECIRIVRSEKRGE